MKRSRPRCRVCGAVIRQPRQRVSCGWHTESDIERARRERTDRAHLLTANRQTLRRTA